MLAVHSLRRSALLPRSARIRCFPLHLINVTSRPFATSTTALDAKGATLDAAYVRHGGTDASSAPRQCPPLTLLPGPVSGWPTPWITAEDFERYMGVLYDNGWGIRFSSAHSKPAKSHPSRVVPELLKTYHFGSDEFAVKFVEELKELMSEENVRPYTKFLYGSTKPTSHLLIFMQHHCILRVANTQVTVYTHTHSARPALGSKNAPGITLRDVRFAMLADLLHSNEFAARDAGNAPSSQCQFPSLTWDGYKNSIRTTMAPGG
ncbi:hypothetical protein CCMSSC00406_0004020 [Pleurotus cornucopiae]|uniref:Uncharacterized protein n=1 Tax=Pleurotus cornucopiae TaxID=5321 RepID=A0ACB7IS16_PLECO|nr:hypothetical protein CCMSSC00406_0004020 [Pleurotus cornucopiae]